MIPSAAVIPGITRVTYRNAGPRLLDALCAGLQLVSYASAWHIIWRSQQPVTTTNNLQTNTKQARILSDRTSGTCYRFFVLVYNVNLGTIIVERLAGASSAQ
jgi:hypothetical protein